MNITFCLNDGTPIQDCESYPWCELYHCSSVKLHKLIDDPLKADLIVFAESYNASSHVWSDFKSTDTYKRFKSKSIVYNDRDVPYPVYPGLYTSIRKHLFRERFYKSVPYIKVFTEVEGQELPRDERTYLYSFIGSQSHPLREKIFSLQHKSDAYVRDSSELNPFNVYNDGGYWSVVLAAQDNMISVFGKSTFVLCPPGGSPNTYRIYEAMSCGAIPVIISDELVLPAYIDWTKCSVRIPQCNINDLDKILRSRRDIRELQSGVHEVFDGYLSKPRKFNYLVRCMEDLKTNGVFTLSKTHLTRNVIDRLVYSVRYRLVT